MVPWRAAQDIFILSSSEGKSTAFRCISVFDGSKALTRQKSFSVRRGAARYLRLPASDAALPGRDLALPTAVDDLQSVDLRLWAKKYRLPFEEEERDIRQGLSLRRLTREWDYHALEIAGIQLLP